MANEETTQGAESGVQEGLEKVAEAAGQVADAARAAQPPTQNIEFILDVALQVTVEVGRARMTIQDLLQLGQGSVVELQKLAGEPLDVFINGQQVARGEAVIVNEKFGVRLTDIISPEDRVEGLGT
ncbi:MAG: flagellar motor switch protein FliN [Deltaproteobacteria bacterium]|nr:flagellar motor switch protein FliN [Deltaproteobacteria bacterium]